jgi:hypothetical protein
MDRSNVGEKFGIAWFWLGIWELGDIMKGVVKWSGTEEENERHIVEM